MTEIKKLNFRPFPGLSSRHLQTILSAYRRPGASPPSKEWVVKLEDNNALSCEVSIPPHWTENDKTVVLIHGLGGSHSSNYMVRISRKLYLWGNKVVRINLRGCGSGKELSKLPYNGGNSEDVLRVLQELKKETPHSEIYAVGFSLGGNVILKLAGELGTEASQLVKCFIAVCPPLDLAHTVEMIEKKRHGLYHFYYLKRISKQAHPWTRQKFRSLREFDNSVTAPLWGYKDAKDYYQSCSSLRYLPKIRHTTHLLFAEDDPFIDMTLLKDVNLPSHVHVWSTKHGGHMGFIGLNAKEHRFYWLDQLLLNWINDDFSSDQQDEASS